MLVESSADERHSDGREWRIRRKQANLESIPSLRKYKSNLAYKQNGLDLFSGVIADGGGQSQCSQDFIDGCLNARTVDFMLLIKSNKQFNMKGEKAQIIGIACIVFAILTCANLPFIVCDLIYATDVTCAQSPNTGVSFSLSVWLQVDAYCRIAILGMFILTIVGTVINLRCGQLFLACSLVIIMIYSLFALCWLIVGAAMFWGNLNKTGECSSQVTGYMYAVLIIGFFGVCLQCLTSNKQRQGTQ